MQQPDAGDNLGKVLRVPFVKYHLRSLLELLLLLLYALVLLIGESLRHERYTSVCALFAASNSFNIAVLSLPFICICLTRPCVARNVWHVLSPSA